MARLRIVAEGKSDKAKDNARGKLFEKIIANVLRCHRYEIDKDRINVTRAGMEIDIEGKTTIASIPVYAECNRFFPPRF